MKVENEKVPRGERRLVRAVKYILATVLTLLLAVSCFVVGPSVPAQADIGGIAPIEPNTTTTIDGEDYYEIDTVEELYWFAGYINGTETPAEGEGTINAVLTADIEINPVDLLDEDGSFIADTSTLIPWTPIGNTSSIHETTYQPVEFFGGVFDGQGHTISGLYYKEIEGTLTGGLFGSVKGTVKRVGLVNSYIEKNDGYTGGICGYVMGGKVVGCYNAATVNGSGICGEFFSGTVSHCYNAGVIGPDASDRACGISGTTGNGYDSVVAVLRYCVTETESSHYSLGHGVDAEDVYVNTSITAENRSNGELAYLLNGRVSADEENAELYWYQTLGSDTAPVIDTSHEKIYEDGACENNPVLRVYTNTDRTPVHEYTKNGVLCDYCYDIHPEKVDELVENGVWQIDSAEDLYLFSEYYNHYACYTSKEDTESDAPAYVDAILLADIDLNPAMNGADLITVGTDGSLSNAETEDWRQWTPIGKKRVYTGTFDGNGHVISHMFIDQPESSVWGFIGDGEAGTVVKDLGIRDSYIRGSRILGSILAGEGTVTRCFSNCTLVSDFYTTNSTSEAHYYYVGGISPYGTAESCYYDGRIYVNSGYGNCKYVIGPTPENCFFVADIIDYRSGSICGYADNLSSLTKITEAQVTDGSLAHMLQQTYLGGEQYWSQGTGYPVPIAGEKIAHTYDATMNKCCCGLYVWDENLTDAYFADVPEQVNGVYQIGTAAELYWFAGLVNGDKRVCKDGVEQDLAANAVLTANITVNAAVMQADGTTVVEDTSALLPWTPMGQYDYDNQLYAYYTGSFDGQGYTISGLYLPYEGKYYSAGLFGALGNGGTIEKVLLKDSYFTGKKYAGGICGYNVGTIRSCYSDAMVTGNSYYGGLCGYGNISYSYYAGGCAYAIGQMSSFADHCVSSTGLYKALYSSSSYWHKNCVSNLATTPVIENWKAGYNSVQLPQDYTISTEDMIASGELAYLLNGEVSADTENAELYWYQVLGTDATPVLQASEDGKIYAQQACPATNKLRFANESMATVEHVYSDGYVCDSCYRIKENAEFIINDGTTWQIGDAAGLYAFNKYMNNVASPTAINVVLTADIDLNPGMDLTLDDATKTLRNTEGLKAWTPVGTSNAKYTGTFDGQGHVIRHLYIETGDLSFVGLFGECDFNGMALIKNTGIVDSFIYQKMSNSYVGTFTGRSGTVKNCFSTAIINGHYSVYGIAQGKAENCYFAGQIYGRASNAECYGTGSNSTNCYSTKELYKNETAWTKATDNDSYCVAVTADQISSGQLAHLLQKVTDANTWSQSDAGYPVPKAGEVIAHTYTDGTCVCGETVGVTLKGHNLVLGELIAVKFHFDLDENKNFEEAYVTLTMPGGATKNVPVASAETGNDTGYKVFTYEVAAKEMKKVITAEFYTADGTLLLTTDYSVEAYAESILNGNSSETAKTMVNKMMAYGEFAEAYFDETEAPEAGGLTEAATIVEALNTYTLTTTPATETEFVRYAGSSLILLSNTTMRIYFELVGGTTIDTVSFAWEGSELTPTMVEWNGKNYYYVDAADIKPRNLDAEITITATGAEGTYTTTLSPMYYVKEMLADTTQDAGLITLLRAFYEYYVAAKQV